MIIRKKGVADDLAIVVGVQPNPTLKDPNYFEWATAVLGKKGNAGDAAKRKLIQLYFARTPQVPKETFGGDKRERRGVQLGTLYENR